MVVYSPAEESVGEGDTSYLQRELGSVLPIALAAVVELQPSDPIAMLAPVSYTHLTLPTKLIV